MRWVAAAVPIGKADRVLEIGCGAGAFLCALAENTPDVAGTDFSASLIAVAQRAIPEGTFAVEEARDLRKRPAGYDVVLTNSVFQYFPNFAYAQDVMTAMVEHAARAVAILDVYDEQRRQAMAETRRKFLGTAGFQHKYEGLDHLYFNRDWFRQQAEALNCDIEVFDQPAWLCDLSEYRFSVVMHKKRNG